MIPRLLAAASRPPPGGPAGGSAPACARRRPGQPAPDAAKRGGVAADADTLTGALEAEALRCSPRRSDRGHADGDWRRCRGTGTSRARRRTRHPDGRSERCGSTPSHPASARGALARNRGVRLRPLRLELPKDRTRGTVFGGHGTVKLGVHCAETPLRQYMLKGVPANRLHTC